MHLFVKDPCVGRASIKKRSDFLRRLISHVNIRNVGKVHVVIQMKPQSTTSLLRVLIQFTLIHILRFQIAITLFLLVQLGFCGCLSTWQLSLVPLTLPFLLLLNSVTHILWEKEVIEVLLAALEDDPDIRLRPTA